MDLQELRAIANQQMTKYGLHGWTFVLADTKRRLGACNYRTRRIEIAEYYARHSPPATVIDTLLHEIAHAIAGPAANHGPVWKAIAIGLGATPRACDNSAEVVVKPGDWQAKCPGCQKIFHRYRRPKTLCRYRCRCATRSPLIFEYRGDPARKPAEPITVEKKANWEAICSGCKGVHLRTRRPKTGVWHCQCPYRCELTWVSRSRREQT